MRRTLCAAALLLAGALQAPGPAHAQIAIPRVQLPRVPGVGPDGVLPDVVRDVQGTVRNLDTAAAADLRRVRIRDLLRQHSDVVEADPTGAPIVRSELLAFSPSDATLVRIRAAGFEVVRERNLDGLDERIVVLRAPPRVGTRRALRRLRELDPQGSFDFNHLYLDSGEEGAPAAAGGAAMTGGAAANSGPAEHAQARATDHTRLGLIDGGLDISHSVFAGEAIHQHGCGGVAVPSSHGTEVASLMTGRTASFQGAAPGAELYAADVYCGLTTGGAVDAVSEAFSWLVKERVAVINVSLVGPPNVMLERVVRLVVARGHLIVAAVGNDGPAAPPLYPAAYPGVVGVTAVDARQRVLVEAERGPQVKFAAPGADMAAATSSHVYATVRGTSFAAPIVAGLLAADMPAPDAVAAQRAVENLVRQAVDLGAPGPDKVYGNGLVGAALRPEPALAQSH